MPKLRLKDDEARFRTLAAPYLRSGAPLDCDRLAREARITPQAARTFARRMKRELGYRLGLVQRNAAALAARIAAAPTTAAEIEPPIADEPTTETLTDAEVRRQ